MKRLVAVLLLGVALSAVPAYSEEIIIWYDEQGVAHKATSPDEIPSRHKPQASGIMTTIIPGSLEDARAQGVEIAGDPALYRDGLGLFHAFAYEADLEEKTGYFFVGTKFNLLRAKAAANAADDGKLPPEFVKAVEDSHSLPVGFYAWNFQPVLLMLIQDGKFIKGEDGFEKGIDPGLKVPAYVKTFPYEALDFSRPVQIQVYSREGAVVQLQVDLPSIK